MSSSTQSSESQIQLDPIAPHASSASSASSSTQLLSGTLVIQSSSSALTADSTSPTKSNQSYGAQRAVAPVYKGSDHADSSSTSLDNSNSTAGRAARRAAKGQNREELRQAFSVFDTDGNGNITTAEFAVVFKMLGYVVSETELQEMIAELDENGDGTITFDEFVSMMTRRAASDLSNGEGMDPIDDALTVFDTSDQKILKMEVSELKHICQLLKENLSAEEEECILKELQPDADGFINYAKLVQQMMPGS